MAHASARMSAISQAAARGEDAFRRSKWPLSVLAVAASSDKPKADAFLLHAARVSGQPFSSSLRRFVTITLSMLPLLTPSSSRCTMPGQSPGRLLGESDALRGDIDVFSFTCREMRAAVSARRSRRSAVVDTHFGDRLISTRAARKCHGHVAARCFIAKTWRRCWHTARIEEIAVGRGWPGSHRRRSKLSASRPLLSTRTLPVEECCPRR